MRRSGRAFACAAFALGATLLGAGVRAVWAQSGEAAGVTLRWSAPAECPDAASVQREIARLLAGPDAPSRRLEAQAEVARIASGRFRVRLVTRSESGSGERTLEGGSCLAVADATALIVAMAVDPARVAANQAAAPAAAASANATLAPTDGGAPDAIAIDASLGDSAVIDASAPLVDARAADASSLADAALPEVIPDATLSPRAPREETGEPAVPAKETSFLLGAAAVADFGTLPNAGLAPSIFAGWTPRPFRLELAAAYFAANHTPPIVRGGVGRFKLITADLTGCADLVALASAWRSPIFAGPCVGGELLSMVGDGLGITVTSSGSSQWLALRGGGLLSWRFTDAFQLDLRIDAVLPLLRPEFVIDASTVHKPAAVSGRGVLGAGFRF